MSILKRHHSQPGTHFVTSRTEESRQLFLTAAYRESFIETLFHYRKKGADVLHAYVLMPDHFHVLLTPAMDKTLKRVTQSIKGGSARKPGPEHNMHFPVWQRGFSDHRIRDLSDYTSHLKHIAENSVRKHLVTSADEYRCSSAGKSIALDAPPQGLKPQQREVTLRHG